MLLASTTPPAETPLPQPHCPPFVEHDLHKAFYLLDRHPSVRDFMLDASSSAHDVALLTTPRPSFTIFTEEEQHGALPGRIALRYLGIPAFYDCAGLSGGAVVTSYADRTHPLHAPNVMADVRVGRYVRDNKTGEWCILTRNPRDGIIRVQYIRVNKLVTRERICLTCSSDLFNAGHFLASVLFQCHDREWRPCPFCGALPNAKCLCAMKPIVRPVLKGLEAVAANVATEGRSRWVGKVRVTVVSNLSRSRLLDIDECMDVRASYQPSMDSALAADMQRLAIFETVTSRNVVPKPLADPPIPTPPPATQVDPHTGDVLDETQPLQDVIGELNFADVSPTTSSSEDILDDSPLPMTNGFMFDDALFPYPKYELPSFLESAMLPADPSTLPGGVELCMEGMDLEEDWCSFITNEKEISSTVSGASEKTGLSNETLSSAPAGTNPEKPPITPAVEKPHNSKLQIQAVQELFRNESYSEQSSGHDQQGSFGTSLKGSFQAQPHEPLVAQENTVNQNAPHQEPPQSRPEISLQPVSTPPMIPTSAQKQERTLVDGMHDLKTQATPKGPRLAPRPAGMNACSDGFIWQMGNAHAVAARIDAIEKERKAEERRKKNRQAAARSNARKKTIMDAYKAEIKDGNARIMKLRKRERALIQENMALKRRVDRVE